MALTLVLHEGSFKDAAGGGTTLGACCEPAPPQSALNTQELHREIGIACYHQQLQSLDQRQSAEGESADNIDNIDNKSRKREQKQTVSDRQNVIGAK